LGSAKQLLSRPCPEWEARDPLLWGLARGMQDADQAIQQQECRLPAAEQARGVRSGSHRGCARSGGQGSHSCGDLPAACLMQIRSPGSKSAACLWRSGASGSAKQLPSGLCQEQWARVPRLWGPGRCMLDADQAIRQPKRRVPAAERGSEGAKQLPFGLCPEQRARVPLLWGPARGMLARDAEQAIRQQERRSPAPERARGVISSSPLGCARPERRTRVPRTHACGDWPVACWMRIRPSGIKRAARLLRSGPRGVRSSSPSGCVWSRGQRSHTCGDKPVACLMRIRLSSSKSTARWRRSGAQGGQHRLHSSPPGCARSCRQESQWHFHTIVAQFMGTCTQRSSEGNSSSGPGLASDRALVLPPVQPRLVDLFEVRWPAPSPGGVPVWG